MFTIVIAVFWLILVIFVIVACVLLYMLIECVNGIRKGPEESLTADAHLACYLSNRFYYETEQESIRRKYNELELHAIDLRLREKELQENNNNFNSKQHGKRKRKQNANSQ